MTAILITASVAPVLASPSIRAEQVTQLVLGEAAVVLESQGSMLRIRTLLENYDGWLAAGYATQVPLAEAELWCASAAWSSGAVLRRPSGMAIRAPHRARVMLDHDGRVRHPAGDHCEIIAGHVLSKDDMTAQSRGESPDQWAWREFAGTPYLWGGITGAGIDCSGLVQNTWVARGTVLPRDAHQQVASGTVIDAEARRPGDLLFFRGAESERVSHVAICAPDDHMVHSTLDAGEVVRQPLRSDRGNHPLLARLTAVRRID